MSEVQLVTVSEDDDGQRLDRWLKQYMPFALVQKLIRKGAVRVDDKKVKQDVRLVAGQEVRIPAISNKRTAPPPPVLTKEDADLIHSMVIYDDGDVIVLNKPSGIAVQGGSGIRQHIDGLLEALTNSKGVKPRIVHRLDKDTSGVLLLARSAEVARELGKAFRGRDIKKLYWAITVPAPDQDEGTIRAPIRKGGGMGREKMMVDDKEGKHATTDFIVIEKAFKQAAFVAFWPRTGRTHQIRIHAASVLGCPVLGDGKYGGAAATIEGMDLPNKLHLHARRITLRHPTKPKEILDITAPLPSEMAKSWKALGFNMEAGNNPFGDVEL